MKIFCHTELIAGFVFGAEYIEGYQIENPYDDGGTIEHFISIDLCFVRIVLEIEK